jgi:Acetyltransferase (GNAT) domain
MKTQICYPKKESLPRFSPDRTKRYNLPEIYWTSDRSVERKEVISLKVLESVEEIKKIRDLWNPLLESSGGNSIFMTYEWIISWLEVFGGEGEIRVLAAYKQGQLIGLCPLFIRKRKFIWMVEFVGDSLTCRADFILTQNKEEVMEIFWDYLWEQRSRWTIILLREILTGSLNLSILGDLLKDRGIKHHFQTCSRALFIRLGKTWNDYLMSRSKGFRNRMQRAQRRIGKKGNFRMRDISSAPDCWETIFDINFRCRKKDCGKNLFADRQNRDFIRRVAERFGRKGWLDMKFLFFNETPVAYQIDFSYDNKSWCFDNAFRSDYGEYHPDYVLQGYNIRDKIRRRSRELELLPGNEPYKLCYTNNQRYHRVVYIFNKTLISAGLRWFYAIKLTIARLAGKRKWDIPGS